MSSLSSAVSSGTVKLLEHGDNWIATKRFSDTPLESGDVAALSSRALALVTGARLLLPDAETLVQRIVVGLLQGHVILSGPPGTGKTTLAKLISAAFNCDHSMVTATADWSAYDVIGGLQPKVIGGHTDFASEILRPWLGHVPRASLACADAMAKHDHDPHAHPIQGHWLIIDEFSRAEIDKAIGPLYTALSGEAEIPLWFGDGPDQRSIFLPGRFRIIGTMNSVDTSFVYSFSQGLTRRFHFISVGVPAPADVEQELDAAVVQALDWHGRLYGTGSPANIDTLASQFRTQGPTAEAIALLKRFIDFVRYGDEANNLPGWPLGTAQIVDVVKELVLRDAATSPPSPVESVDLAIADRIVPQMSGLLSSQLAAFNGRLRDTDMAALERTRRALQQVREAQTTAFA
jgi:5-methylcytosine-specific restriction protein B